MDEETSNTEKGRPPRTPRKTKPKPAIPLHPNPHLTHAYTDKAGNHYYQFADDLNIPYKRYITAQIQERLIRFGLTDGILTSMGNECQKKAIDGKATPENLREFIMAIGMNIKQRLGFMTSEDTYLQMAGVYYLLEGEPLDPHESWFQRKKDLWHQDEAAKDFFLHGVVTKLHASPQLSIIDIKTSLIVALEREANIPILSAI